MSTTKRGVRPYRYRGTFFPRTVVRGGRIAHTAVRGAPGVEVVPEQWLVGVRGTTTPTRA